MHPSRKADLASPRAPATFTNLRHLSRKALYSILPTPLLEAFVKGAGMFGLEDEFDRANFHLEDTPPGSWQPASVR